MKETTRVILAETIKKYPCLTACEKEIESAFEMLLKAFANDKKLLLCGNGGSAADCEHIVGELMKSFKKSRALSMEEKQSLAQFDTYLFLSQYMQLGKSVLSFPCCRHCEGLCSGKEKQKGRFRQRFRVLVAMEHQ